MADLHPLGVGEARWFLGVQSGVSGFRLWCVMVAFGGLWWPEFFR